MKCLITGAGGLIGGYLAEYLVQQGEEVIAVDVQTSPVLDGLKGKVTYVELDMFDHKRVLRFVEDMEPDAIFHLAAQSLPMMSWSQPARTFEVNVGGTVNLLKAITETRLDPVVVIACSSGEYASSSGGKPIKETDRLDPSSPYAVSKAVVDHFVRVYGERFAVRTIRARPFFLVGPRKQGDVCSDFARGVIAIARGEAHVMRVGNLDVVRDIMDVRDGVSALWLLAQKGAAGEAYNVCTGNGTRIGDILDRYAAMAGVTEMEIHQDPMLMRPMDEMVKIGDASRLRALGWTPQLTIGETLKDIYEYWSTRG